MRSLFGRLVTSLGFPWLPAALAGAGGLAFLQATMVEPERLEVRRIRVPVEDPTGRLDGVRLAQISDLHVGSAGWRASTIAGAIAACNQAEVDLIALTGDFLGRAWGVDPALELLAALRTDVPRVAVLGNHDHVYGRRPLNALLRGLEVLGIVVLGNRSMPIELKRGRVWLVGVDDGYSLRDDLGAAMAGLGLGDFPRLLLTHYPEVAVQVRRGEVQLSVAGHTHAGQIRLPIITSLVANGHARTNYSYGLYRVNGNPLFVTAGVGMSGVPFRFRNPPEVAVLHLEAGRRAPVPDTSPARTATRS